MKTTHLGRMKKALRFVGAGILLTAAVLVAAPRARAAMMTVAELQARVDALQAELARIQGDSSGGCFAFGRDITLGSTGSDVAALQAYLKTAGYFPATVGASGTFGQITRTAVAAWQSTNGLSPASGYFGKLSRARYEALCRLGEAKPFADNDDEARSSASDAIDAAAKAIDDARHEIDDADDNDDDVDDANDIFDEATAALADAQEAFDDDDFKKAKKLASDAQGLADDAVDAIDTTSGGHSSSFIRGTAESPVGGDAASARFELEFKLSAFNGSFYIPRSLVRDDDPSDGSSGFEYVIEGSGGAVYTGGSASGAVSASGSSSGDTATYFKVSEGKTRTFTVKVSLDNEGETAGFYGLQLTAIRFDDDTNAGGEQTLSAGLDKHETKPVSVGS